MTGRDGYGILSHAEDLSEAKADCCVFRERQQAVWLEPREGVAGVVLNKIKVRSSVEWKI